MSATATMKSEMDVDVVIQDSFDIVLPASFLTETTTTGCGECSMLVQIEPQDATLLDFEGASGAIGRFESDENGIILDLKGYQYNGTIHPGPTAMVLTLRGGEMKVDAITDEFVSLTKTTDVMAKLNAVVKGSMDESYKVVDDDINQREKPSTVLAAVEEGHGPKLIKGATKRTKSKIISGTTKAKTSDEKGQEEQLAKKRKFQSRKRKAT